MKEVVINGIKYTGITEKFPDDIKYFTDFVVYYDLVLDKCDPGIDTITATAIDINVTNINLIDTTRNLSYEGQYLSGKKILVDFKILFNIKYIAGEGIMDICMEKIELYKCVGIVVPMDVNGSNMEDIVRKGQLSVNPYIESIICQKQDLRELRVTSSIVIDIDFL